MIVLAVLFLLPFSSNAWFFSSSVTDKWDDLKLTWDLNPLTSAGFDQMPRTSTAAIEEGFTLDSSTCEASASKPFLGKRFIKDGDTAAMLLYDRNGYIAGIQTGIPTGLPNNYPPAAIRPPMIEEGNKYIITAYFVDPATICTSGRTAEQFSSQGTGTGLYIQNGTDPVANSMSIPMSETDLANTLWTRGKCFKTMGVHYWFNLTLDMDCDRFQPMFLMYNVGKLNAFGWSFQGQLESDRYEHPPRLMDGMFMDPVPGCLSGVEAVSTMHIFLTNCPITNWC